ncbi:unnamed protein product [Amoebophrya sp. A25]|nr:unnamed protein product [Amoebophrya sp. A25]|eukprot:GSA25T00009920001.1
MCTTSTDARGSPLEATPGGGPTSAFESDVVDIRGSDSDCQRDTAQSVPKGDNFLASAFGTMRSAQEGNDELQRANKEKLPFSSGGRSNDIVDHHAVETMDSPRVQASNCRREMKGAAWRESYSKDAAIQMNKVDTFSTKVIRDDSNSRMERHHARQQRHPQQAAKDFAAASPANSRPISPLRKGSVSPDRPQGGSRRLSPNSKLRGVQSSSQGSSSRVLSPSSRAFSPSSPIRQPSLQQGRAPSAPSRLRPTQKHMFLGGAATFSSSQMQQSSSTTAERTERAQQLSSDPHFITSGEDMPPRSLQGSPQPPTRAPTPGGGTITRMPRYPIFEKASPAIPNNTTPVASPPGDKDIAAAARRLAARNARTDMIQERLSLAGYDCSNQNHAVPGDEIGPEFWPPTASSALSTNMTQHAMSSSPSRPKASALAPPVPGLQEDPPQVQSAESRLREEIRRNQLASDVGRPSSPGEQYETSQLVDADLRSQLQNMTGDFVIPVNLLRSLLEEVDRQNADNTRLRSERLAQTRRGDSLQQNLIDVQLEKDELHARMGKAKRTITNLKSRLVDQGGAEQNPVAAAKAAAARETRGGRMPGSTASLAVTPASASGEGRDSRNRTFRPYRGVPKGTQTDPDDFIRERDEKKRKEELDKMTAEVTRLRAKVASQRLASTALLEDPSAAQLSEQGADPGSVVDAVGAQKARESILVAKLKQELEAQKKEVSKLRHRNFRLQKRSDLLGSSVSLSGSVASGSVYQNNSSLIESLPNEAKTWQTVQERGGFLIRPSDTRTSKFPSPSSGFSDSGKMRSLSNFYNPSGAASLSGSVNGSPTDTLSASAFPHHVETAGTSQRPSSTGRFDARPIRLGERPEQRRGKKDSQLSVGSPNGLVTTSTIGYHNLGDGAAVMLASAGARTVADNAEPGPLLTGSTDSNEQRSPRSTRRTVEERPPDRANSKTAQQERDHNQDVSDEIQDLSLSQISAAVLLDITAASAGRAPPTTRDAEKKSPLLLTEQGEEMPSRIEATTSFQELPSPNLTGVTDNRDADGAFTLSQVKNNSNSNSRKNSPTTASRVQRNSSVLLRCLPCSPCGDNKALASNSEDDAVGEPLVLSMSRVE